MKTLPMFCLICAALALAWAQNPLETVYGSGVYGDQQLDLLTWSDRADTLYFFHQGTLQSQPMLPSLVFGSNWHTAMLPVPDHSYIGFSGQSTDLRVNPVFWDQAGSPPAAVYTLVETDPAGDSNFPVNALDILYYKASFSDSRFFFAIKNNATTFPTSSGLTYYSYMVTLVNPNADPADDPPVYGLMYTVNLGSVISPGLYKITGTGFGDLNRLGDIEAAVDSNTNMLVLSCARSDLTADPDFDAWFDESYPLAAAFVITSRITLTSGIQEADATASAKVLFKPQSLPLANQLPPVLSDADAYTYIDGYFNGFLAAQITYFDPDANFPRICSFSLDGGEEHQLFPTGDPLNLDFSLPQTFAIEPIDLNSGPNPVEGRFRFSHGDGFVYHTVYNITPNSDPLAPQLPVAVYPNPVQDRLFMEMPGRVIPPAVLSIYNLKGQKLLSTPLPGSGQTALAEGMDVSDLPSGIYFLRVDTTSGYATKRFVKK